MKKLLCTGLAVLATGVVFGDVFDDALIWWRGAYDENGDGQFAAAEFYNHRYAKTDAEHQTGLASLSGSSTVSVTNSDVVSVWCGQTNNMPVLRFNQDVAGSSSILTLKPKNVGVTEAVTAHTIHLRFKWDGDFGAIEGKSTGVLFSTVNYWNCRGVEYQIANGKLVLKVGRKSYDCTHFGLQAGMWYDLFFYTSDAQYGDTKDDHNCSMRIDIVKAAGSVSAQWPGANHSGSTWLQPEKYNTALTCTSTAFDPADAISIGENFKGEIAQFGFWPRQLTDDEIRRVSASPVMGPATFAVGKADGKSDEFAKSPASAQSTVTLPGTWDCIPAQLDESFPKVSFRFFEPRTGVNDSSHGSSQITYYTTFDHVLVMKAAADSPKAAVQVFLDKGTAKERKLGKRLFTPGSAEYFWISAMGGNAWHTLDVEWIEGTFKLDYAKLAGSWCLGNRVYAYTKDNYCQYKGNSKPYPLEWNSPCQSLTGGLEANSATYTDAAACTLSFDLDEELARLDYIYTAATGQSKDAAKTHSVVYVNGVEFGKYTNLWQFGDIGGDWIKFPAGTFKPGRNTLAIRYDTDYHASGYWVTVRGHIMLPKEASLPEPHRYLPGGIVILR